MELTLTFCTRLCGTDKFLINGIGADYDDFGYKRDEDPDNAEPYGCGYMHFTPKKLTQEVLDKYMINESEYHEIAEKLRDGLSFGRCDRCC